MEIFYANLVKSTGKVQLLGEYESGYGQFTSFEAFGKVLIIPKLTQENSGKNAYECNRRESKEWAVYHRVARIASETDQ